MIFIRFSKNGLAFLHNWFFLLLLCNFENRLAARAAQ